MQHHVHKEHNPLLYKNWPTDPEKEAMLKRVASFLVELRNSNLRPLACGYLSEAGSRRNVNSESGSEQRNNALDMLK